MSEESSNLGITGNDWDITGNIYYDEDDKLIFDGSSYMEYHNVILGGNDFTIDFWVYCDQDVPDYANVVTVVPEASAFNSSFGFLLNVRVPGQNTQYNWRLLKNNNAVYSTSYSDANSSSVTSIDVPHHIAVVYQYKKKLMTFYIDGNKEIEYTNCAQYVQQNFKIQLGNRNGINYLFKGAIKNFRLYNDLALWTDNFTPPSDEFYEKPIEYDICYDIERNISNIDKTWRYENHGIIEKLSNTSNSVNLTDLNKNISKTTYAFTRTTRSKCFDVPKSKEIYMKLDIYCESSSVQWRVYNQNVNGSNYGILTGITNSGGTKVCMFAYNNDIPLACPTNLNSTGLHTFRMHMLSHKNCGFVEVYRDGEKIISYNGNVNNGEYFDDIYVQANNTTVKFSNIIISNGEIGLNENVMLGYTNHFDYDIERNVIRKDLFRYIKAYLPFDNPENPGYDCCGNKFTVYSNADISEETKKYGNGSINLDSEARCDDNGKYIECPNGITLGGKDFTIDFWMKLYDDSYIHTAYCAVFAICQYTNSNGGTTIKLNITNSSTASLSLEGSSTKVNLNLRDDFHHIAVVYNHTNKKLNLYYDGNLVLTINKTINETVLPVFRIGKSNYSYSDTAYFKGFIDEFRIFDGIALWTNNFVPPKSGTDTSLTINYDIERKLKNDAIVRENTIARLHFDDEDYPYKDEYGNIWTTVRNISSYPVSITDSVAFNKKSISFYKNALVTNNITLGGKDFTIDGFALINKSNSESYAGLFSLGTDSFTLYLNDKVPFAVLCTFNYSKQTFSVPSDFNIGSLFHFAVVYRHNASTVDIYINGNLLYTRTNVNLSRTTFSNVYIGDCGDDNRYSHLSGNIDEFRIVDGCALYYENFIPAQQYKDINTISAKINCDIERKLCNYYEIDCSIQRILKNDIDTTYDIERLVTNYDTINCDIERKLKNIVNTSSSIERKLKNIVTVDCSIQRILKNDIDTTYDIERLVTNYDTSNYDIECKINNFVDVNCNIERKLKNYVDISYDINLKIKNIVITKYDIERITSNDDREDYDIERKLKNIVTVDCSIQRILKNDIDTTYDLDLTIKNNVITKYDIERILSNDREINYDIERKLKNIVTVDCSIQRILKNDIDTTYDLDLTIKNIVNVDCDIEREVWRSYDKPSVWLTFEDKPDEDIMDHDVDIFGEDPEIIEKSNYISNKALKFKGKTYIRTQKVELGNHNFTVEGWCYTDPSCEDDASVFDIYDPVSHNSLLQLRHPGPDGAWRVYANTSKNLATNELVFADSGIYPSDEIHYFAVLYDYHGRQMIFALDGNIKAIINDLPRYNRQKFNVDIGARRISEDDEYLYFSGELADFCIYDGITVLADHLEPPVEVKREAMKSDFHYHIEWFGGSGKGGAPPYGHSYEVSYTVSTTGHAFTGERIKVADVVEAVHIWIKFDVYTGANTYWQIYNENDNGVNGIYSHRDYSIDIMANDEAVDKIENIVKPSTRTSVLLHMKSDPEDGLIEYWYDNIKRHEYHGNVNNGEYFENIFLHASDDGTLFSNFIISKSKLRVNENVKPIGFTHDWYHDIERNICNSVIYDFDIVLFIKNICVILCDLLRRVEHTESTWYKENVITNLNMLEEIHTDLVVTSQLYFENLLENFNGYIINTNNLDMNSKLRTDNHTEVIDPVKHVTFSEERYVFIFDNKHFQDDLPYKFWIDGIRYIPDQHFRDGGYEFIYVKKDLIKESGSIIEIEKSKNIAYRYRFTAAYINDIDINLKNESVILNSLFVTDASGNVIDSELYRFEVETNELGILQPKNDSFISVKQKYNLVFFPDSSLFGTEVIVGYYEKPIQFSIKTSELNSNNLNQNGIIKGIKMKDHYIRVYNDGRLLSPSSYQILITNNIDDPWEINVENITGSEYIVDFIPEGYNLVYSSDEYNEYGIVQLTGFINKPYSIRIYDVYVNGIRLVREQIEKVSDFTIIVKIPEEIHSVYVYEKDLVKNKILFLDEKSESSTLGEKIYNGDSDFVEKLKNYIRS